MYSRPPDHDQQRSTLGDIVHHLDGTAQALTWLHLVEEQRQPVLGTAAFHLSSYIDTARQAVADSDLAKLDEVVTLRLGTLAALLQIVRAHWECGAITMTAWTADALAEIAHWVEQARQAISRVLGNMAQEA